MYTVDNRARYLEGLFSMMANIWLCIIRLARDERLDDMRQTAADSGRRAEGDGVE